MLPVRHWQKRREVPMKSDSKFLSAPYTVWMTVFIVLVGYFAFTDK